MNEIEQIKSEFEFELDDFQLEALNHINNNNSVVVCAPTGAGKTVIAEFAIKKAINAGKRIFYTTPLKALSNQKFHDFAKVYGEDNTGLLTGDISINRDASVVVMTTEVFRNMLYGTTLGKIEDNLKNVHSVILDEVHYMNDEQRGTVWEESIIYCPTHINIVALSATVQNADQLTDWINTVHNDTKLVNSDFRPVPLRHYYFSGQDNKVVPLFAPGGKLNNKIEPEKRPQRFAKKKKSGASLPVLVNELHQKDMLPAIFFTFSRKRCDENVSECAGLELLSEKESKEIQQIIDEHVADNTYLSTHKHLKYLYAGVASHHAGLLPAWKNLVENLFQKGLIKVVFATETLAAGINMPARTTVITSISKRTDNGHRILTSNEFLQMSGRAGRRGMDKVGHVVVVGTPFQSPDEVAELVSSSSDPLTSKFTPSYSMVTNLLQRFDMDIAKELILKSFGYYNSNDRLKHFYKEQEEINDVIDGIEQFNCPFNLKTADMMQYNKTKNTYIQYRKITNTLRKQAKQKRIKHAPEVQEYEILTKQFYNQMVKFKCDRCKAYKKHIKGVEVLNRYYVKREKLNKVIDFEKDIYWKQFVDLSSVLEGLGYLNNQFPTEKGVMLSSIRSENEVYFAELIISGVLNNLTPAELASFLCAVITEEQRGDRRSFFTNLTISENVKKALNEAKNAVRKISKVQKKYNVEANMCLNSRFSPFIEAWVNGIDWNDLTKDADIADGDLVRTFKRTVDLLRQLTNMPNVPREVAKSASMAIECINRDPIAEDF